MREGSGGPVGPADAPAVPSAMSATHARRASRDPLCAASSPTRPGGSPARRGASLAEGWATRAQLPSHQHPAGQLGREGASAWRGHRHPGSSGSDGDAAPGAPHGPSEVAGGPGAHASPRPGTSPSGGAVLVQ